MQLEGILKSDIFFFVATIATIILTVIAVVAGIYVVKMLREVRAVVKDIRFRYRFVQKFIKLLITRRR